MLDISWTPMLRVTVNKATTEEVVLEQWAESPSVYLDHWALRSLSKETDYARRFTAALKSAGGTLMLSWLNLGEFSRMTDASQAQAAEELIDACMPNIFLLEVNPTVVVANEDQLVADGPKRAPHTDIELARLFVSNRPGFVAPLSACGLFTAVQGSELRHHIDSLADTFLTGIAKWRRRMEIDRDFAKRVRGHRLAPQLGVLHPVTRYLWLELVRPFLVDPCIKATQNHAIDLMHTIVPVAYCETVLLDAHWKTQIDKVRHRLAAQPLLAPMAKVISGKKEGLERFLRGIEQGDI